MMNRGIYKIPFMRKNNKVGLKSSLMWLEAHLHAQYLAHVTVNKGSKHSRVFHDKIKFYILRQNLHQTCFK